METGVDCCEGSIIRHISNILQGKKSKRSVSMTGAGRNSTTANQYA